MIAKVGSIATQPGLLAVHPDNSPQGGWILLFYRGLPSIKRAINLPGSHTRMGRGWNVPPTPGLCGRSPLVSAPLQPSAPPRTHTLSAPPWGFLQGSTVLSLVPTAWVKLTHVGPCCLRPGHPGLPWDDFLQCCVIHRAPALWPLVGASLGHCGLGGFCFTSSEERHAQAWGTQAA